MHIRTDVLIEHSKGWGFEREIRKFQWIEGGRHFWSEFFLGNYFREIDNKKMKIDIKMRKNPTNSRSICHCWRATIHSGQNFQTLSKTFDYKLFYINYFSVKAHLLVLRKNIHLPADFHGKKIPPCTFINFTL